MTAIAVALIVCGCVVICKAMDRENRDDGDTTLDMLDAKLDAVKATVDRLEYLLETEKLNNREEKR